MSFRMRSAGSSGAGRKREVQPSFWRRPVWLVVAIFLFVGGFIVWILAVWLLLFLVILLLVAFFLGDPFSSAWEGSALVATILTGLFMVQAVGEMVVEGSFRGAWWALKASVRRFRGWFAG